MKAISAMVLSGCMAAGPACAERPSDFAYGLAIHAEAGEALYRLQLPRVVYLGVVRRDLGDLRVFNGAGEVVPHAFRPRAGIESREREPVALRFFPLYGDDPKQLEGLSLRVERRPSGTIVRVDEQARSAGPNRPLGFLVDASGLKEPVRALELDVKSPTAYSARVDIDASDDLSAWRTVAQEAPLLSLQHEGATLEQRRVEFAARTAKYFRISWAGMPRGAQLGGVRAERGDVRLDAARTWEVVPGRAIGNKPGEYAFDTRGLFPADRVRFVLPQPNTVAEVHLLSRARDDAQWRPVTHAVAYRLRRDGVDVANPEVAITQNADRYWLLRVDQRGGGLGAGEPQLSLGWLPHEIVWVARGEPPFTLAYGSRDAQPSGYAMEALVPGYNRDADLRAKAVSVEQNPAAAIKPVEAEGPTVLGGQRVLEERIDLKRWTLWGALLVGVAFLGWMAWRLAKQMGRSAEGKSRASEDFPAAR
jgi:Protein of unknown function (DUF3999)